MIGLKPRALSWVIPHRLAIGERPGGYGTHHRRIRREEEIFWLTKLEFGGVISLIPSTQNLQAYEEVGIPYIHLPVESAVDAGDKLDDIFRVFDDQVRRDELKIFVHGEDVDDVVIGICGGYLLYLGVVDNPATAVATIEVVSSRPLGAEGRAIIESVGSRRAGAVG